MKSATRSLAAFSLIEVTIALGVAAFCLVTVLGLLPVGISSNQNSIQQTVAANLARAIVSDLRATQAGSPATSLSPLFNIPIPANGSGSAMHTIYLRDDGSVAQASSPTSVDVDAAPAQNPRYRVTLMFSPPGAGQQTATPVRVLVTWPALADSTAVKTPANFIGAYEIVTGLARN